MRNSFIFLKSYFEAISELPEKDQGKMYKAVIEYAMTGKEPNLTGVLKGYFSLIKPNIDSNNSKYDVKAENGKKGGNPNFKKGQSNPYYTKNEDNLKDNLGDNLNITENNLGDNLKDNQEISEEITLNMSMNKNKEKENPLKGVKERETSSLSFHAPSRENLETYGKYANVLLTQEEYETLKKRDFGIEAIDYFSEYRAMKGYKCKNDYLAINKWAFDGVLEARKKRQKGYMQRDLSRMELTSALTSLEGVEV